MVMVIAIITACFGFLLLWRVMMKSYQPNNLSTYHHYIVMDRRYAIMKLEILEMTLDMIVLVRA